MFTSLPLEMYFNALTSFSPLFIFLFSEYPGVTVNEIRFFPLFFPPFFSSILKEDMIWFDLLSWYREQGFMYISALGLTFVQNGTLGNTQNSVLWIYRNVDLLLGFFFLNVSVSGGFPCGWSMSQAWHSELIMNLSRSLCSAASLSLSLWILYL